MSDRVLAKSVHPVSAADIDAVIGDLTAPKLLLRTAAAHPDLVALRSWRDGTTWNEWTLRDTLGKVAEAAAGYQALGVEPAAACVFEDAVSGVEAGHAGHFGHVVGVDRVNHAAALREHGADVVVDDLSELL